MPKHGDLSPLPADLAHAADEVIDVMISASAREVTATGCPLAAALRNHWTRLAAEQPDVWALTIIRLEQTGNDEMLAYAISGRPRGLPDQPGLQERRH